MSFSDPPEGKIWGHDISFYQDNVYTPVSVNFDRMVSNGASFVIIRHGQALYQDTKFKEYWANSKGKLIRQVYHFLVWEQDPRKQAEFFWNSVKDDPPDPIWHNGQKIYGWWIDFEWWNEVPSNALSYLWAFAVVFKELAGFYPGLYTAPGFWKQYGSEDIFWTNLPLWTAEYHNFGYPPEVYAPWNDYVFWQYSSHGDGISAGVESLNVDMNIYNGTKLEIPEMPDYSKTAKIVYVDGKSTSSVEEFSKYDCVLAVGVRGTTLEPKFTNWVQMAADANIPLIMMFENDPELYREYSFNPDQWGGANDMQLAVIKRAVMSGSAMRAVHGVMVNASKVRMSDGVMITPQWISSHANYMLNLIADQLRIPTFLYMDKNPINAYPGDQNIINLIEQHGISTYSATESLDETGRPNSSIKPDLAYWGSRNWFVWLYKYISAGKSIEGITLLSKTALWDLLLFAQENPGETPQPENPNIDLTELKSMISDVKSKVDWLTEFVKTITAYK